MNVVERARLKEGQRIKWKGRNFVYYHYAHKVHILKDECTSEMYVWQNGHTEVAPVYEYLSNAEILGAEVIRG
jgi:hypothetical protein